MSRARATGKLLIAGSLLGLLAFGHGVVRRSYLALALPVTAAVLALTALTFWLGWTLLTIEAEPEDETPA